MKTKIRKTLVVAFMLGTLISYANVSTEALKTISVKRVKVEFNAVKKGQNLVIKSQNGITIYKIEIENDGNFSKIFDFTALENGNYTAELDKDFEIIIKPFSITNGLVAFSEENNSKVFKPVIRAEENLLMISKIALDKKPLKVTLYYKDDILLNETLSGENILKRVYKLSKSYTGNYKIVIEADKRTYVKDFTI